MNENLKRHRPDIKVLGEGKAIAFMPEDPMGVWCHIQEVRDLHASKAREYTRASLVCGKWLDDADAKQCWRKMKCAAHCREMADRLGG